MKVVSVYIKAIEVAGVLSKKDLGQLSWQSMFCDKGLHYIPSHLMSPYQEYNVIASEFVTVHTLTKDPQSGKFFDLGQTLVTDNLIKIEVLSFELLNVFSLETKTEEDTSVVLVNLIF